MPEAVFMQSEIGIRQVDTSDLTRAYLQIRRWALVSVATMLVQMAAAQTFTVIDAPSSGSANGTGTYVTCINANAVVAGYYRTDGSAMTHGYVRAADGTFTEFDPPNSGQTFITGINKSGAVVGTYYDTVAKLTLGYLRQPNGVLVILKPSTTTTSVQVSGINDNGEVVGWYKTTNSGFGFYWTAANGYTKFLGPPYGPIEPNGVNASGEIAGLWAKSTTPPGNFGFVRSTAGVITTFDIPGGSGGDKNGTDAVAINIHGTVAGNVEWAHQGFLRSSTGSIVTFAGPGGSTVGVAAMNDNGGVVGSYIDATSGNNTTRPFRRTAGGVMSEFNIPVTYWYATATGINNSGHVVGYYQDASGVMHGWLK